MKAEACFQLARALHVQEEYDRAYNWYLQASLLNEKHTLALLGLGQMHVQKGTCCY